MPACGLTPLADAARCPDAVNHHQIFPLVGVAVSTYPYYDPKTIGLAFDAYIAALKSAPPRSVFLIHACAHNPTGVDPTQEQWGQIADVMLEKGHFAFFDCAYQGFASGDLDNDAWAVREFVRRSVPMLVCQVRAGPARGPSRQVCSVLGWADRLMWLAELRQERRAVRRARRSAARRVSDEGGRGADQEPAVRAGPLRD